MLKAMIVILAMFGSVSAQATSGGVNPMHGAVQDHKAVGPTIVNRSSAIQDHKAVGPTIINSSSAIQDHKAVGIDSQIEATQLLDLNEGF